ncbi:MAG: hypothetical protein KAR22_14215 [Gammaproteobacteria bacterium]|jgi:hypothetical protein|nr:hypothetical protein [Gammaproteobacteria bacterium]
MAERIKRLRTYLHESEHFDHWQASVSYVMEEAGYSPDEVDKFTTQFVIMNVDPENMAADVNRLFNGDTAEAMLVLANTTSELVH